MPADTFSSLKRVHFLFRPTHVSATQIQVTIRRLICPTTDKRQICKVILDSSSCHLITGMFDHEITARLRLQLSVIEGC